MVSTRYFVVFLLMLPVVFSIPSLYNLWREYAGPFTQMPPPKSFYEIATSLPLVTDKVTNHEYHHLYDLLLHPLRVGKVKLLEIGLGCNRKNMGASVLFWSKYFPQVELHIFENDEQCLRQHHNNSGGDSIYFAHPGDQSNTEDLARMISDSGGRFDVIVDDGGHTMNQQLTSLFYLFEHALKPGGYYYLEDYLTSWLGGHFHDAPQTTLEVTHKMIDKVIRRKDAGLQRLKGILCGPEMCVFIKGR